MNLFGGTSRYRVSGKAHPPAKAYQFTEEQAKRIEGQMLASEKIFDGAGGPLIKLMARRFLGRLISFSPILTGRYVNSHKVGINGTDPEFATEEDFGIRTVNRKSMASRAFATGANKIGHSGNPTSIHISNSLNYAANVEFIGWDNTPPYFTYTKAGLSFQEDIPQIKKDFEKFIQEQLKKTIVSGKPMGQAEILREREHYYQKDHFAERGTITGYGETGSQVWHNPDEWKNKVSKKSPYKVDKKI